MSESGVNCVLRLSNFIYEISSVFGEKDVVELIVKFEGYFSKIMGIIKCVAKNYDKDINNLDVLYRRNFIVALRSLYEKDNNTYKDLEHIFSGPYYDKLPLFFLSSSHQNGYDIFFDIFRNFKITENKNRDIYAIKKEIKKFSKVYINNIEEYINNLETVFNKYIEDQKSRFIGFKNVGNSCFFNSLMQLLISIPEFTAVISYNKERYINKLDMLRELLEKNYKLEYVKLYALYIRYYIILEGLNYYYNIKKKKIIDNGYINITFGKKFNVKDLLLGCIKDAKLDLEHKTNKESTKTFSFGDFYNSYFIKSLSGKQNFNYNQEDAMEFFKFIRDFIIGFKGAGDPFLSKLEIKCYETVYKYEMVDGKEKINSTTEHYEVQYDKLVWLNKIVFLERELENTKNNRTELENKQKNEMPSEQKKIIQEKINKMRDEEKMLEGEITSISLIDYQRNVEDDLEIEDELDIPNTKKIKIYKFSQYLLHVVSRYLYRNLNNSTVLNKIFCNLKIPKILTVYDKVDNIYKYYTLSGVIIHSGNNSSSGHYQCILKNDEIGKWVLYNDDSVTDFSDEDKVYEYNYQSNDKSVIYCLLFKIVDIYNEQSYKLKKIESSNPFKNNIENYDSRRYNRYGGYDNVYNLEKYENYHYILNVPLKLKFSHDIVFSNFNLVQPKIQSIDEIKQYANYNIYVYEPSNDSNQYIIRMVENNNYDKILKLENINNIVIAHTKLSGLLEKIKYFTLKLDMSSKIVNYIKIPFFMIIYYDLSIIHIGSSSENINKIWQNFSDVYITKKIDCKYCKTPFKINLKLNRILDYIFYAEKDKNPIKLQSGNNKVDLFDYFNPSENVILENNILYTNFYHQRCWVNHIFNISESDMVKLNKEVLINFAQNYLLNISNDFNHLVTIDVDIFKDRLFNIITFYMYYKYILMPYFSDDSYHYLMDRRNKVLDQSISIRKNLDFLTELKKPSSEYKIPFGFNAIYCYIVTDNLSYDMILDSKDVKYLNDLKSAHYSDKDTKPIPFNMLINNREFSLIYNQIKLTHPTKYYINCIITTPKQDENLSEDNNHIKYIFEKKEFKLLIKSLVYLAINTNSVIFFMFPFNTQEKTSLDISFIDLYNNINFKYDVDSVYLDVLESNLNITLINIQKELWNEKKLKLPRIFYIMAPLSY